MVKTLFYPLKWHASFSDGIVRRCQLWNIVMQLEQPSTAPQKSSNSARQVARILLQYPILAVLIRKIVRLFQGRYTAGVVGVVVNARGEVLIVEHVFHPESPWGLPGGWLGWREDPHLAVARE